MFILKSRANRSSRNPSKCGKSLLPLSANACIEGASAVSVARVARSYASDSIQWCRSASMLIGAGAGGGGTFGALFFPAERRTMARSLERFQHALLNGFDLVFHGLHGIDGTAHRAHLFENRRDLGEDVPDLGVCFDDGAAAQVAVLPLPMRVVSQLLALK